MSHKKSATKHCGARVEDRTRKEVVPFADTGMKCYMATKHSGFVSSILKRGKGVNVAAKNFNLLNDFLNEADDPAQGALVTQKWLQFRSFLDEHELEMALFYIGFESGRYHLVYSVQSTKHNTPAAQIDRSFESVFAFNFVPQFFVGWLDSLLDDVPYDLFLEVAAGK